MRVLRALLRRDDGIVAVETALVMSFILVPLLLALWDVAQLALAQAQLDEALQDVLTYVSASNSNAGNATGITTAAQAAYGTGISVTTSTVCYCVPTGTATPTSPTSVACAGSCASGNQFEKFLNVTVSASVTIPFPLPYLSSPSTVASSGVVRTG
jgi:Flp pilus assembly protein TadG